MKKTAIILFFAAFVSLNAMGQSIQEGINHLNAERLQSAKSTFEKLLAANPNNIEANYWLGQTYIAQKNIAAAKSLYEKALAASNNAPLIVVGMGHVTLLEGKTAEARQRFESAINASRGKKGNDPNILNAVGKANVDAFTESNKAGDLDYAISKLNEAVQLAPNNAEIYLNLGNAHRKKREGTSGALAVEAYRKAAQLNPKLAVACFRAAMLYKTQVNYRQPDAWSVVLDNLNCALAADPNFAPAYEQLYYYHLLAKKDFPTAETFATKYINSSDPSVENDYIKAQTYFVQNKFTEAVNTAKNILSSTNNNAKARVYRLLGYSYMGMKDTTTACDYVNQFFTKATDEDIIGQDYLLHAQACGKNNPEIIRSDIAKAIQMDSVLSRQMETLNLAIEDAKKSGQRCLEGELALMRYQLRAEKANPAELVSIGVPFYFCGQFPKADSLFQAYNKAFPDSIYGYMWSSRALVQIDTAMSQGLAVPAYEQTLKVAETNPSRELYKGYATQAAGYLAVYYNNVKGDKATALSFVDKGLAVDPTNATLLDIKKKLSAAPARGTQKNNSGAKEEKVKTSNGKTKVKKG